MNRQKSFEGDIPSLYLVPTPIGNLSEMSPRAIEILQGVDVIACEDTRTSGSLLRHFGISKRLIAYHNFNEETSSKGILSLLEEGKNVALISDAGYPLINDPGQRIVLDATEAGYPVIPVSGPSAFLNALVASGLIAQPFIFVGFLPQSNHDREKKLQEYVKYPMTMVFYEAPHRIEKMLQSCLKVFGDRHCVLARELTKVHEEFIRGTISEILPELPTLKGEMVIVMEGCTENPEEEVDMEAVLNRIQESMASGISARDAIRQAAKETGIAKNVLYDMVHSSERSE